MIPHLSPIVMHFLEQDIIHLTAAVNPDMNLNTSFHDLGYIRRRSNVGKFLTTKNK